MLDLSQEKRLEYTHPRTELARKGLGSSSYGMLLDLCFGVFVICKLFEKCPLFADQGNKNELSLCSDFYVNISSNSMPLLFP